MKNGFMKKNVYTPKFSNDIELEAFNYLKSNYRCHHWSNSTVIMFDILNVVKNFDEISKHLMEHFTLKKHEVEKIYWTWHDLTYLVDMLPLFNFLDDYLLHKELDLSYTIKHKVSGKALDLENDFIPYTTYNIPEITNGILFWKGLKKGLFF